MDNFRNILNKAKKFAKLELKTYIEEFEEKLTKFHTEKKEQEVTARNAQIHQQKIDSRENFNMDKNSEDYSKANNSDEADGEVIDTCNEETNTLSINGKSKTKPVPEASSSALSELTEPNQMDIEVQSPMVKTRGGQWSRIKKNNVKEERGDISITKKRVTRSRR
ncbi:unnamed protein product [Lathyrus sativus]|nr:unnamed protein product [Lathyrus sativus]